MLNFIYNFNSFNQANKGNDSQISENYSYNDQLCCITKNGTIKSEINTSLESLQFKHNPSRSLLSYPLFLFLISKTD